MRIHPMGKYPELIKDNINRQPELKIEESFTIAFYVPEDNCDVKLEVTDKHGTTVKTVVNNPHAKGKWQYEVKELPGGLGEVLFCRLKVNDNHTVKKLVHLGK